MAKAARDYLKEPYARVLIPTEDGSFAAEVLEFPGCYSFGKTPDEAFQRLEDAAESWIEASLGQGHTIPEPFGSVGFSGKFALRMPRSLHRRAAKLAEKDRVSLNQFCVSAIAERVGSEDLVVRLTGKLKGALMNMAEAFTSMRTDTEAPAVVAPSRVNALNVVVKATVGPTPALVGVKNG